MSRCVARNAGMLVTRDAVTLSFAGRSRQSQDCGSATEISLTDAPNAQGD